MQKIVSKFLLILCILASVSAFAQPQAVNPRKGVVRVKVQSEVAAQVGTTTRLKAKGQLTTGIKALDATVQTVKGVSIRRVFPYNPQFEAERAKYGLDRWYEISFDESVDPLEARRLFAATSGVQIATNVVPMVLKEGTGEFRELAKSAPMPYATTATMPFNDPRLGAQWHYFNDGTMEGTVAGADINLFEAWKTNTGSPNVLVAIIDGGVDVNHEDLAAHMFVNTAELNGTPGVDDDGNGYVDDVYGYNFCTMEGAISAHQHGTHVAGTVAAVNNNGIGVCGVAGGDGSADSGVRIISCQVFDSRTNTPEGDFAAALVYAAEMGADIAQCSWGWDTDGYYEQDVIDAVNYFQSLTRPNGVAGGLCIFAAGNTGVTGTFYPACLDNVLSVAAMTPELKPAPYSSNGSWVDVVAPGGLMDYNSACGVLSTLPDNKYGYNEGTSMACPHVSGIAALILSQYPDRALSPALLKQQIETSVNDFYATNPSYAGLFGTGYVDAAKALQMGDGAAPAAVSDLVAVASQESVLLQWTIPASSDNNVNHHVVYYSTEAFDATTDASNLKSVEVDTKFYESGYQMSYELTGLLPMTQYHLAIKAVNRWGNASDLSEVITVTTNAGPKMSINVSSLSLTATPDAPVGSASFVISNDDAGVLKWAYKANTTKATIKTNSLAPTAKVVPFSGTLGSQRVVKKATTLVTDEYDRGDYPQEILSWDYLYAYIGESDKSLPNSMAQYFTVDPSAYPNGFNLTTLKVQGANGDDPTIQIYRGGSMIAEDNLVLEFQPSWFTYDYNITMPQQVYFAPGESFWVVYHFQGDQESLYPLGLGVDNGSSAASQAYMSNDLGQTWTKLSEVLKGTSYESLADRATWCITAISQNPDFSQLITLTPSEGQVMPGTTQEVTVANDGQPLCNGTYTFNLTFETNETEKNTITLPVTLTVSGQKPELSYNKIVSFGDLIVGQSKTITVEVFNKGYGNFVGSSWGSYLSSSNISSTSEHFTGPSWMSSGFPARSTTSFDITYTPQSAGSHSGQIVFTNVNGLQFKVMVQGVATDPAEITIEPEVIELGDLNVADDPREVTFTITNTGNYPLQYVFPKFSDETVEGGSKSKVHKFGYTYTDNIYGEAEYDYNPELVDATDITSVFTDDNYWSEAIPVGFEFPYYGETYEEVYITSFGGIAMSKGDDLILRTPLRADAYSIAGTGMISAYGSQLLISPNTKIEYAKADGKFVVKFTNVMAGVEGNTYTPISFHMALSPSGDVEIYYDSYDPYAVFQEGSTIFVGINDINVEDPMTITSADIANMWYTEDEDRTEEGELCRYIYDGTVFHIIAPKPNIVTALAPADGLVAPGEVVTVTATIAPNDDLVAGETFTRLTVLSNDFVKPTTFVQFNANVVGDLNPEIALAQDALDFGKVFRTSTAQKPLTIKNGGRNVLTVTDITLANGKFSFNATLPIEIPAGQSKDVTIVLPTDQEGAVSDVITITSEVGVVTATLTGEVIGCPTADLSYDAVDEVLDYGTSKDIPLTITNNGNEDLQFSVTPGEHISNNTPVPENAKVSYAYSSSLDDPNVKMEWVDIETTGLGTQSNFTYFLSHDFVEVDLPFDFPYFGKTYNKMWICATGFVTFNEYVDQAILPEPPSDFPAGSIYTNMIAPYWGLHSMDQTKTAGTFHYVTEDEAIVSFIEYGNSMNIGVCYQLILKKDGSFKFNYKAANDNAVLFGIFGLAGIMNDDASDFIRLSERCVEFGEAVQFTPVVETTLAPNESAVVDLTLNADALAGEYYSQINVNTNVPGSEKVEIPVSLVINGSPEAVFPNDVFVEHPVGFYSTDYNNYFVAQGAMYTADFTISNAGSAPFTIDYIEIDAPQGYDDYWEEYYDVFYLYYYGQQEDWWSGETVWTWINYYDEAIEVGSTPIKFSIPMMSSTDMPFTVGEYDITLTFHISGIEGVDQFVHHTKFIVTPEPVMALDREEIRVTNAAADYEGVETLTITNAGEYRLDYSLYVDPTGVGEEVEDLGGGGIAPASLLTPEGLTELRAPISAFEYGQSDNLQDMPQGFDYLNGLYYPHYPGNNKYYVYGSGSEYAAFKAATVFEAPAEGFNITHIYNIFNLAGLAEADVKVEIFKGDDPSANTTVMGKGVYSSGEGTTDNVQAVIPLDHAVYMAPGEVFNVVVTYPIGAAYPAWLLPKEEGVVANRYMGYVDSYGWFDIGVLFNDQYGSLGYVIACVETVKGDVWCKLDTDVTSGSIQPGQSVEVPIRLNASSAPLDRDNKAVLVIKTNDPYAGLTNFPIYLDKNAAPQVSAPENTVLAKEGETTSVDVVVYEPDGDQFTLSLSDYAGLASISSVVGATATNNEDGTFTVTDALDEVTVTVAITADYGDAGIYRFTLAAADVQGHETQATVRYEVEHVNRAPVANETTAISVTKDCASEVIVFADLFTDPDDDEMTYQVSVASSDIVTMYLSDESVIFVGKQVGTTTATVVATDANGATGSTTLEIEVKEFDAINDISIAADVDVRPNPVVESLYVTTGFSAQGVRYEIYAANGSVVFTATEDAVEGTPYQINIAHFPAGNYVLRVAANNASASYLIIKK